MKEWGFDIGVEADQGHEQKACRVQSRVCFAPQSRCTPWLRKNRADDRRSKWSGILQIGDVSFLSIHVFVSSLPVRVEFEAFEVPLTSVRKPNDTNIC